MAIGDVLKNVCFAVGLSAPTAFYSAQSGTVRMWQELQMLANQAAEVVTQAYDWQTLRKVTELNGNGLAEAFDMPANFGRMLKKANVWSSRYRWDLRHIVNSDDWLSFEFTNIGPIFGVWTMYGNQMHVQPIMAAGEKVKLFYVSNQIVRAGDGTMKVGFSADDDVFLMDEAVLKYAIIYMWKQMKAQDFAAELADYEIALDQATDRDGGSKPVLSGNTSANWHGRNVWPGTVSG